MVFKQVVEEINQLPRDEQRALLRYLAEMLESEHEEGDASPQHRRGSILAMQGFLKGEGNETLSDGALRDEYLDYLGEKYR